MGDSKTLEDFIAWGVKTYLAEHMGVIYWNHGGGSIYGACSDENYEGMLTLSEFDKAMANGTKNMTDKFDFIGFDACLMATVECANIFAPYADYMLNIADLIPEAENVAKLMEDAVVYEKHGETFMDTKGLSFYYCYGNMTFSDMNILRNITISPYLMNYIEKVAYGTQNYSSLEGFESSNWENNEYYLLQIRIIMYLYLEQMVQWIRIIRMSLDL